MKIALVSPYDFSYPGGVTEHTAALAHNLQQRGHHVHVLAASSGYRGQELAHTLAVTRNVTKFPVGGTVARVGLSPLSYFKIGNILRRESYDVIHLQEPLTPSITWYVLLQNRNLLNAPIVGTFHAYHDQPNWFYWQGRPIFGKLFSKLNSLIAVSQAAQDFAYRMFPAQYKIIPNGVDLDRFGKRYNQAKSVSNQKITILFVGRLDKRKGLPVLLQAFAQLKAANPNLGLQVIGPFDSKRCRLCARWQSTTDIEFVGYISPERLPDYYHKADIFCAPSLGYESFGIILLEAMAAGLPIVASNIAGYRSVITPGQEGVLVPPGQPNALARALQILIDQPQLRLNMSRLGRLKAEQYSWNHIVDQTIQVYIDMLEHKTYKTKIHPAQVKTGSEEYLQRRQVQHAERSSTQI